MDINDLRIAITVLGLVLFLSLVRWAYSRRQRAGFDAAAQLPFEGEAAHHETGQSVGRSAGQSAGHSAGDRGQA